MRCIHGVQYPMFCETCMRIRVRRRVERALKRLGEDDELLTQMATEIFEKWPLIQWAYSEVR